MRKKIYSLRSIVIATLFGGPLITGILLSKNYKVFEKKTAARFSLLLGIALFILFIILFVSFQGAANPKLLKASILILNTALSYVLVDKLQGDEINTFLSNGGQKKGVGEPILYATLIVLIGAGGVKLFTPRATSYGYNNSIKITKSIKIYFKGNLNKATCDSIGQVINNSGFIGSYEKVDLFLNDEKKHYKLRFVLQDVGILRDTFAMASYHSFENYLNDSIDFLEKDIKIGFTDRSLKGKYTFPKMNFKENSTFRVKSNLLRYRINSNQTVYYNESMPMTDIKSLEQSINTLHGYFPKWKDLEVIFINNGDDYTLKLFAYKPHMLSNDTYNRLKDTHHYIQGDIETNINLVLIDTQNQREKAIDF